MLSLKKYIDSIRPQLKGKQGNPGKNGVGEKGRDGSTWLFSEETPDKEIGIDGDFCLCEDGDVYHKSAGEWVKKLSLKGKDAQNKYIGGGVTEDRVIQLIIDAIDDIDTGGGGGSSELVTEVITGDYVVTDEDFIIVNGNSGPVQITMPATATRRITVKQASEHEITIIPDAGDATINGVSNLQIPALSGALGEANFGTSLTLIRAGGQFWIN